MNLLILSKDQPDLAFDEARAILNFKKYTQIDNIVIFNKNISKNHKNLAYTNQIIKILISTTKNKAQKSVEKYTWGRIIKKDFAVKKIKNPNHTKPNTKADDFINEKSIADLIWSNLKKKKFSPSVNLNNPETEIVVLNIKNKVIIGSVLWKNQKEFLQRKPHQRPYLHPTSLNPKLARGMINLLSIKNPNTNIIDPFCGTGGFLIEAGLMGYNIYGLDINQFLLKKCKEALTYYNIKKINLTQQDALTISSKFKFIITDLPYGKNTKKIEDDLYINFLIKLKKNKIKKAVICFPDSVAYNQLIHKSGLKIIKEYSIYIHKSMTKKIVILK